MSTPTDSVIVMGVSGSGKSTVGALLARKLGLLFVDGDDLHPTANKQKMAAGVALDDADRAPWLDVIARMLARAPVVVAASALKRRYRDRLRRATPDLKFIYLKGPRTLLAQRLGARAHEFMPPGMLDSQLALLEPPGADEGALTFDIRLPPEEIVDLAAARLTSSHKERPDMIDHTGFTVSDLKRSRSFYVEALRGLGIALVMEVTAEQTGAGAHAGFGTDGKPFFWIGDHGRPSGPVHIAFTASSRAQVDSFYQAALKAGGRDNGAPGLRPHYHTDYYGAFVLDPDGNNIEAVCHRPP